MEDLSIKMNCFTAKKVFVDNLSQALSGRGGIGSIEQIKYEVFSNADIWFQEYVIVTFTGGAISARNVNGNSHSAILRDLSRICDGGYYDEVTDYVSFSKNNDWKKIL